MLTPSRFMFEVYPKCNFTVLNTVEKVVQRLNCKFVFVIVGRVFKMGMEGCIVWYIDICVYDARSHLSRLKPFLMYVCYVFFWFSVEIFLRLPGE